MSPVLGRVGVLQVGTHARVAARIEADTVKASRGRAVRAGDAELDHARAAQLEQGAQSSGQQRVPEALAAKGEVVVAVEHADERLETKRQVGRNRGLEALFYQPVLAKESDEDVRPIDLRQVVVVTLAE